MNNLTHDTINKSLLLNWLYMAKRDVELAELGNWIEAKTEGEYRLVKNSSVEKEASISRQLDKECLLEGAYRINLDGKGITPITKTEADSAALEVKEIIAAHQYSAH